MPRSTNTTTGHTPAKTMKAALFIGGRDTTRHVAKICLLSYSNL
jgi:hypothetical protein